MPNIEVFYGFLLSGVGDNLEDIEQAHKSSDKIVLSEDESHSSPGFGAV